MAASEATPKSNDATPMAAAVRCFEWRMRLPALIDSSRTERGGGGTDDGESRRPGARSPTLETGPGDDDDA